MMLEPYTLQTPKGAVADLPRFNFTGQGFNLFAKSVLSQNIAEITPETAERYLNERFPSSLPKDFKRVFGLLRGEKMDSL